MSHCGVIEFGAGMWWERYGNALPACFGVGEILPALSTSSPFLQPNRAAQLGLIQGCIDSIMIFTAMGQSCVCGDLSAAPVGI